MNRWDSVGFWLCVAANVALAAMNMLIGTGNAVAHPELAAASLAIGCFNAACAGWLIGIWWARR